MCVCVCVCVCVCFGDVFFMCGAGYVSCFCFSCFCCGIKKNEDMYYDKSLYYYEMCDK